MLPCRLVLTHTLSDSVFCDAFDTRMEAGGGRATTLDNHICIKTIVRPLPPLHLVAHRICSGVLYYAVSICTRTVVIRVTG